MDYDYIETLKQKFTDLKNVLCVPFGNAQKDNLMFHALDSGLVEPQEMLSSISRLYTEKEQIIKEGGIIPVKMFLTGKDHQIYPVLDKSGKFCIKHYGEDEWNDVSYVFYKMDVMKAWDIVETFNHNDSISDSDDDEEKKSFSETDDEYFEWSYADYMKASGQERFNHYAKICESHNFVPVNWERIDDITEKCKLKEAVDELEAEYYKERSTVEIPVFSFFNPLVVYIQYVDCDWYVYVYTNDQVSTAGRHTMYTSLEQLLDDSDVFFIGDERIK